MSELKHLTKQTLDEAAATNPKFKQVYDAYENFRANYQGWDELSEEAYRRILRIK